MKAQCLGTGEYEDAFGMRTFQREICRELGEEFWYALTKDMVVPDMEREAHCQCRNMNLFMRRFEQMAEAAVVKRILMRVRHGLTVGQCAWTRERFLKTGDLDRYLAINRQNVLNMLTSIHDGGGDFYGQRITDEVLAFIRRNPSMLGPVRKGNKLYCMAFPADMENYLKASDARMKRYYACHCPFAKESIRSQNPVSGALCNCGLGHIMNFTEAFLDRELEGRVLTSVLRGDAACTYEITLPEDVMEEYVVKKEVETVISNYNRYFSAFARSGIVELHEGTVRWIMPWRGQNGPDIVFCVQLEEKTAREEIQRLIAGIRSRTVPKKWLITPGSTPENIVALLEENGFMNLSANAAESEPTMVLNRADFRPFYPTEGRVLCRRVRTMEDFRSFIDVVNRALHGWDMIDAEHYYAWIEKDELTVYLGEIDGIAVSTAATIQTGEAASLEFVSTLAQYRRRKAAISVCSKALQDLLENGVERVTLSACGESVPLYERLGFHRCFDNVIMQYDGKDA